LERDWEYEHIRTLSGNRWKESTNILSDRSRVGQSHESIKNSQDSRLDIRDQESRLHNLWMMSNFFYYRHHLSAEFFPISGIFRPVLVVSYLQMQ